MEEIALVELREEHFTDEYVSWHDNDHTEYYSSTRRKFSQESLLLEFTQGLENQDLYHYGIKHIEDNKLIGVIKLGKINKVHKTSDLVAFIGDQNYLGRGLAVQAIREANNIAFTKYGLRKLFSGMYRKNISSVKAYLKAGWVIEGVLKNQYLHKGEEQDRILVACFNPSSYSEEYYKKGICSFDELYNP